VGDSAWEGHAANVFEKRDDVLAYAKNDHLGFQIYYMWAGSRRRYVPDFLVRLAGGTILALEIKGTDSPQNKAKRDALNEWVKGDQRSRRFRTLGLGRRVQAGRGAGHHHEARGRSRASRVELAFRPERDRVVRSRFHLDSATGIEVFRLGLEFIF
jgi:hypothetical protein